MPDSTASQRALESAYAVFSHGLQEFYTGLPDRYSQQVGPCRSPAQMSAPIPDLAVALSRQQWRLRGQLPA